MLSRARDYADLYLFGPLGITARRWPSDPQGINVGGAELMLTEMSDKELLNLVTLDIHAAQIE